MTQLPKLERMEQLELQNIMLQMALEQERMAKYNRLMADAKDSFMKSQEQLATWNRKFNKEKLEPLGLDLTKVDIDPGTGVVSIAGQEQP